MTIDERLKFMRAWVYDLNKYYPEGRKEQIECLNWAIKQCQQNVNRKRAQKKNDN